MKEQHGKKITVASVIGNVVLGFLGLLMALGLVEMLMRAFPNWVPLEVRVNPPARRIKPLIDETYDLRQSDGDLFHYMHGNIVPLSPEQDQVVAHIHMLTDANGFRNAPPEKATYPIVALGDSFTRASGVAGPWPQELAEHTGSDVLNLGDVGFAPQDELKVLRQYGLNKNPKLVILAYFEGNDLYDAASYEQANPFILFRFGKYMLGQGMEAWQERRQERRSDGAQAAPSATYRYPIPITINHKELETVFFSYYVSWLSLSKEEIAASQNFRIVSDTILRAQELSEAGQAHFLLVYVPSKEHIYLPYLNDVNILSRVFTDVPTIDLDEAGFLQFTQETATLEATREHMDDQAHLLADFAAEQDINFLDLTSTFQKEASAGAELYYPFDTHWNQRGHDLAAETIYEYLKARLPDTANQTTGN